MVALARLQLQTYPLPATHPYRQSMILQELKNYLKISSIQVAYGISYKMIAI